ncbi:hypothetical protein PHMEG_0008768 [Phytophthora megakarya]|uniref:Uncharacterized protein n=1 Tax=Phytophthora megakarya TaxID=4795 RepID=A0A225WKD7_9STRA|nr:hypothetical protein PHMEG_0008768 [Phytophthora megakarya]
MEMQFLSKLVIKHYTYGTTQASYKFHEAVPGVYLIQFESDEDNALDEPSCEYSVTKSTTTSCTRAPLRGAGMGSSHQGLVSSLRSKPERELPAVSGDPLRVEQVLKKKYLLGFEPEVSSDKYRELFI